jgi:hypothetical protein
VTNPQNKHHTSIRPPSVSSILSNLGSLFFPSQQEKMAPVRNRITKTRARKLRAKKRKAVMPRQQEQATETIMVEQFHLFDVPTPHGEDSDSASDFSSAAIFWEVANRGRQQPDEEIPDLDSETSSVTGLQQYEDFVQDSPRRGSSASSDNGSDWFGSILPADSEGEISKWGNETDNDDASTTYNMDTRSSLNMQSRGPHHACGPGFAHSNTTTLSSPWISPHPIGLFWQTASRNLWRELNAFPWVEFGKICCVAFLCIPLLVIGFHTLVEAMVLVILALIMLLIIAGIMLVCYEIDYNAVAAFLARYETPRRRSPYARPLWSGLVSGTTRPL